LSLIALALVVLAALLHAGWNIVAKRHSGGPHFAMLSAAAMALLWSPVGIALAIDAMPSWTPAAWAAVFASGIVHLVYFNALLTGYRVADLTVVYPVARGAGPLLASVGAFVWLHEEVTAVGVLGLIAITLGVASIAGGRALFRRLEGPQRSRRRRGIAWGLFIGALIAMYTVIDGYAVKSLLVAPIVMDWTSNLIRTLFMLPRTLLDRAGFAHEFRRGWRPAMVLGVLSPLGYILVLYAITLAPLSHVAPARELSTLFAALVGGKLLGEGERGTRLLGAGLIAVGVMALAWR
jgi:drug/metabolite transporter (DMT)-like permease